MSVDFNLYAKNIEIKIYNKKFKMSSITETEHALYMFTRTLKKYKKQSQIDLSIYADGLAFG